MSTPKRILIIDDHPLYRDGLKARLESRSDLCVVGEAGTCAEGLRQSQNLSPDLAIIDISLPDGSGIELTREIRLARPDLPVLIVSMHAKLDFIAAAFQAGASGYMSKESGGEGILQAIDTVPDASFGAALHDPPRFGIAGELYSAAFYAQLARVLKRGARLFHYTGTPNKLSSGRLLSYVFTTTKSKSGFTNVVCPSSFWAVRAPNMVR